MTEPTTDEAAFVVDDDEAARCPYCGRPFPSDHLRTLHVGETHGDTMTDAEAEAYAEADDQESDDLFVFHLKVLGALSFIMFLFVYSYSFVWS
ncbi:hypothetical protein JCM30237_00090 [Halolamina litorea]|uniref:C2H2-type domain-containing protein n=1 Tax=Halolamina litorea TaxID=1515593 RepID=A0ABD6BRM6_9EURY|nr:hypothetical protein [Halolamina litorea]